MFDANIKGWIGELKSKVTQGLLLDGKVYRKINNLIINDELGSTQIDHVIVSRYGLFVVETKDMSGWIFGSEKEKQWTQSIYGHKTRFQNPLHQNYRHAMTLASYLGIEQERIHPVVIFWGDCTFKTHMPVNVIHGNITGYTSYIKGFTEEEVEQICLKIQTAKKEMGFFSGVRHVKSVNERYNSTIKCPKCGGNLIERNGSRGTFLGCSNYPKCRYTKEVDG